MSQSADDIIASFGKEPAGRFSADEMPAGFFDDGPSLESEPAHTKANGAPAQPRKTARERQAEEDRARIVWGRDLDVEPEPTRFVSEGFLAAPGRPAVICGEGGTGKSLLLQYLLACVSTGLPFFGKDVQRGKSMLIDYETSLAMARRRMRRFARGYGFSLTEHSDRIAYVDRPFYIDDIDRSAERLADLCQGFTLVGIDSAFRSAPRLKQNDAEAAIPFEVMTRASNWTGCVFAVVDHASTKRDEGARRKSMQSGNHHKLDGAGTVYMLTSEKHEERWLPTLVTCEREQLEGEYTAPYSFAIEDVLDPSCADRKPPYSREEHKWGLRLKMFGPEASKAPKKGADEAAADDGPALAQIADRILQEIKKQPGISSGELLEKLGIRKQRFNTALNMLRREPSRIVNRTGKETRTEWIAS